MAATTDIRTALAEQRRHRSESSWLSIAKLTATQWADDDAMTWAAALSCYIVLALAPLLVVAVKIALVFARGHQDVANKTVQDAAVSMGPQMGDAIAAILSKAMQQHGGIIATVISLVLVVVSVGGVFAELQQAMNRIWKVKPRAGGAMMGFIRARLKSIVVVGIAAVLLMGSVIVVTKLGTATKNYGTTLKVFVWVIDVLLSTGVMTLLFALVYRTVPDADIAWKTTWVGAFISAILFELGKYGLALYFRFAAPTSAFGAVGSLAAALIWIYYSSMIVFFGAEFTYVYAMARGHGVRASRHAQPLLECDETETATPSAQPPQKKPPKPTPHRSAPHRTVPRRQTAAQQYAAVLEPHAVTGRTSRQNDPATLAHIAQQQETLRNLLIGSAGLAVGAIIGGYGALHARTTPVRAVKATSRSGRLHERTDRAERKVRHALQVQDYLQQDDVNERLDALHRRLQSSGRRGIRPPRRGLTWRDRLVRLARNYGITS